MSINDVQRILWYLEDDKATGRKGIYSMITKLEQDHADIIKRVSKVEEAQRFDKWRFTAIGGAVGGIIAVIAKGLWALIAKVIF